MVCCQRGRPEQSRIDCDARDSKGRLPTRIHLSKPWIKCDRSKGQMNVWVIEKKEWTTAGSVAQKKRRLTVGKVFVSCVHERFSTTASRIVCARRSRLHVCCRSSWREEGVGNVSCMIMEVLGLWERHGETTMRRGPFYGKA